MKKSIIIICGVLCAAAAVAAVKHPVMPEGRKDVRLIDNFTVKGKPVLVPEVQKYSSGKGGITIPAEFTVDAPANAPILQKLLTRELKRHNSTVKNVSSEAFCKIAICDRNTPENPQGYRLEVSDKGVVITSRGDAGLFYGVQTLCNLIRNSRDGRVAACSIEDWPDMDRRGYFFTIRYMPPEQLPNLKRSLDVMASLRINWLLLEFAEAFPYKNNPLTLRKNAFTEEQVRDLVAFCKERHIEITPLLQVWSHALWMTFHPEWKKMREGIPDRAWNNAPCPLNQQARDLTAKAVAEQIELIKPKTFCLTLDEIYLCPYNVCKECKKHDFDKVAADYFKFAEDLCYSRGVQAMICQDELFDLYRWPHGEKLRQVINRKNNILWWSYRDNMPVAKLDPFVKDGFEVTGHAVHGRPLNTWNMSKLMQSIGSRNMTIVYWYYSARGLLFDLDFESPNSLGGFVNSCDYMWKLSDRHHADFDYDGTLEMMRRLYPEKTNVPSSLSAIPVPINNSINAELSSTGEFPSFKSDASLQKLVKKLAQTPEKFQLLTSPGGKYYGMRVTGVKRKGDRQGIGFRINNKAKEIAFLMTATVSNNPTEYAAYGKNCYKFPEVARIKIMYADNTSMFVPILYRRNIANWNQPYGGAYMRFAVRGIDDLNKYYSLGVFDWVNPHPEKTIRDISFHSAMKDGISPVILAISLKGGAKPYPPNKLSINPAVVARRASVASNAIKVDVDEDLGFEDEDLKGAYIFTTGSVKAKDVKMEFVNDPSSLSGKKVLKLTVPPAKIAGKGDAGMFIRISLDMPYTLPAKAKTLVVAHKLNHKDGFSHANEYLVAGDNKHYWVRTMTPTPQWSVDSAPLEIKVNRAGDKIKSFKDTRMRRVSYFFHYLNKPVEIYIDYIGTSKNQVINNPEWYHGSEPTIFR